VPWSAWEIMLRQSITDIRFRDISLRMNYLKFDFNLGEKFVEADVPLTEGQR